MFDHFFPDTLYSYILTLQLQDFEGLTVSDIKTKAVVNRDINHRGPKIMNRLPGVVEREYCFKQHHEPSTI